MKNQIPTRMDIFTEEFAKLTESEKHDLFKCLVGCFMKEYETELTRGAAILYSVLSEEWQRATISYIAQTTAQHGKVGKVINIADIAKDFSKSR